VITSGNRSNIFLNVERRSSSSGGENTAEDGYIAIFKNLLEELVCKDTLFPKTIVYTKLKWCGYAYDYFARALSEKGSCGADISMVSQYHASCKDDVSNDYTYIL
jgi:hypothetical protein